MVCYCRDCEWMVWTFNMLFMAPKRGAELPAYVRTTALGQTDWGRTGGPCSGPLRRGLSEEPGDRTSSHGTALLLREMKRGVGMWKAATLISP